jgi:hypothetical protein
MYIYIYIYIYIYMYPNHCMSFYLRFLYIKVQPKGWDVVSMYRIMRVTGTGVKQKLRPIPWINLRELIDRFRRNDGDITVGSFNYNIDIGDWTDMYVVENTTASTPPPSPPFFILPSATAPFSPFPTTKIAPMISPPARVDGSNPQPGDSANAVYWSPLGLLDMFNTGGGIIHSYQLNIIEKS